MFGQPRTRINKIAPVRLQLFSHCFRKREERFQAPIFFYSRIISPVYHLHSRVLRRRDGYYRIVEGDLAAEDLLQFS